MLRGGEAVKKLLLVAVALVIVLVAGLGFFWPFRNNNILRLHGIVEIQEVRLGSKVSGRVGEVLVKEGTHVKSGARLVVFEVPELEALRDQLKAKLGQAKADHERIKNGARKEEKQAGRAAADATK